MPKQVRFEGRSLWEFYKGFRSEATKESYAKKLRQFLEYTRVPPDDFLAKSREDPKWAEHAIIDYVEFRRDKVSGSTIRQLRDALKHFYEMNDFENGVNWAKIVKMMPRSRKVGSDRAPTVEEVRKMVDGGDLRMRCIILLMCSSGVRVGAFDSLTWGDVEPIEREGKVAAARLTVYRGEPEEYQAFVTPECYQSLVEYRRRREAIGEAVAGGSPLIRDNWDRNPYRERRKQDPKVAVRLSSKAIRNEVGGLLEEVGLRSKGGKHEFKQVHGFRKFFKTQVERTMKTIDVEKLLGHAENYYKPPQEYLLEEYLKAVPLLTVSEAEGLKTEIREKVVVSDRKVGELERENVLLQDRLTKIENDYGELKGLIETRLLVTKNSKRA